MPRPEPSPELADSELGRLPFVGLQRRDVKRWWAAIKSRVDAGRAVCETANKRLTMLRAVYNFALDDEAEGLGANPTARIKKLRIDPSTLPTEHFQTEAERERVIESAQDNPRLHAAVLLAIFYGLRRASICDLQVRDVDLAAGTIGWVTKTGSGWCVRSIRAFGRAWLPSRQAGVPVTRYWATATITL